MAGMGMRLIDVNQCPDAALYLYALLLERPAEANISHRRMPTAAEHLRFIASKPYFVWYLLQTEEGIAGSVYISKQSEVGIFIFRAFQGRGLAKKALKEVRRLHPGQLLANVAPNNKRSHALFKGLGGKVIQHTYELP